MSQTSDAAGLTKVHRIEVRPATGRMDPRGMSLVREAKALGVTLDSARVARVYLVRAGLSPAQVDRVKGRLLADPVTEAATLGVEPVSARCQVVEVHPLPGVMDPAAQSVREAVSALIGAEPAQVEVSTGWRYDLTGVDAEGASRLTKRLLANPAIHQIHAGPWTPDTLPRGKAYSPKLRHVPIRELTDEQLAKLSREAHLFLSMDEMKSLRAEYRTLGREPTDIELETIAQTWSEHCVHKTLKSTVRYVGSNAGDAIAWDRLPGTTRNADGSITVRNLLKSTVAAATNELIADGIDWTLSVFKDNSGVIAFDDDYGVCIKVETHNRPSAIEPYGGAATGIGGCIRDVIGTGLGSRPIASTDVFVVAHPDHWVESDTGAGAKGLNASGVSKQTLPPGAIHPKRILSEVVAGIRDYGNRMGIPTVSGAVWFDDRHVGNPLVFAGCIGLIPRALVHGGAKPGDRIIALGGRTGRDGIHGATFSSAELESTHADEFSHAVQIGNAIEEKRVLEAILRARDEGIRASGKPLYNGMTDCGAGGFSSAIGEMGSSIGARVHLERAPLKYEGLSYTEIWISEAQERMILAVPEANLPALRAICAQEQVELAELGTFGTPGAELVLSYHDLEVGRLPMSFLHDGIPMPTREATWTVGAPAGGANAGAPTTPTPAHLLQLLAHPNIASKHWIIRQYDHEVRGGTAVKPMVGRSLQGPSDASVITPVPGTTRGVSISCGLQTGIGDPGVGGDPYQMVLSAIDECVRNLVCVGTDPTRIAILDNFCWPGCAVDYPRAAENMASLVRACAGCYEGAKAYRTPFVSGKDSLNNQLRYTDPATGEQKLIQIPPTLLITGMGIVPDVRRCVTMDAKKAGNLLVLVGTTQAKLGGSHVAGIGGVQIGADESRIPVTDLVAGPAIAKAVAGCIDAGLVAGAHDVSDGGLLCAAAEMLIASGKLGATLDLSGVCPNPLAAAFGESPSRYLLEIEPARLADLRARLGSIEQRTIGTIDASGQLRWGGASVGVAELTRAWRGTLDW